MTRFARARGSKSSNERAPEDGTPWEVMKEQLLQAKKESEESQKRKEAEQQRIANYENFLKEHKVQKRKATWCDFPESNQKNISHKSSESNPPPIKSKKKSKKIFASGLEEANTNTNQQNNVSDCTESKDRKIKKKKIIPSTKQEPADLKKSSEVAETVQTNKKNKKRKNKQNLHKSLDSISQVEIQNNSSTETNQNVETTTKSVNNKGNAKLKKNKKLIDGKPVRRKEINDHSFQLIVNGKEIELVRVDGFPVMKKDAERLQELKDNMIKKGIPKSEVQRTMKLERRRAEKALARMKREVCYNCRKGGHVLSDCPELKSKIPGADTAEGVCFKCGSTEHRQFECKVQRDKEFRFATCFICKEPGHIARQCPDNPKGLYPNGGSCKLCGDVTHLRKDCPTVMDKKQESTVKVHTLASSDNIEDVGQQNNTLTSVEPSKKPKKIKF